VRLVEEYDQIPLEILHRHQDGHDLLELSKKVSLISNLVLQYQKSAKDFSGSIPPV